MADRPPIDRDSASLEYPKIARLQIGRIPCRICGVGLQDREVVVWFEQPGGRSKGWLSGLAHAECAVFIQERDGAIVRLSGAAAIPADVVAGTLLLTRSEWVSWLASVKEKRS